MLPFSGGAVVFAGVSMGYWPAVFTGLATSFAYIGIAAWEGPAIVKALFYIIDIPKGPALWTFAGETVYLTHIFISFFFALLIALVNIFGPRATAIFQKVATSCIILVGVLFIIGSVFFGRTENIGPAFTDYKGFSSVLLMVPAMFVGFDIIPQTAGDMNVPSKKIPSLLVLSIIAAAAWYILMIAATCFSAPTDVRQNGTIPVADAMAYVFANPIGGKICILGAVCGILSSWNGFLLGAAEVLAVMAQADMLPKYIGRLHPKFGTPWIATMFCAFFCCLACLLGTGALTWLVNASSFGVVLMYLMATLSFIFLRIRKPQMRRPYRIKHAVLIAAAGIMSSVFFAWQYLPFGPSPLQKTEWLLVIIWFMAWLVPALFCRFTGNHSKELSISILTKEL